MKGFTKRVLFFLSPILLILISIISYNCIFDPYGVIKEDFSGVASLEPNQRCIKSQYLKRNPNKYNSFLFGSSRVGYLDVSHFKSNNPNDSWYNMTYSEGLPAEHLHDLKFMLKKGIKIKQLIIGVDNVSYSVEPNRHLSEAPRKPYVNQMYPLVDYLLLQPKYSFYQKVQDNKKNNTYVVFDIHNTGGTLLHGITELIENDITKHNTDPKFNEPNVMDYYYNRVDKTISEIKEIIDLCKKNNITYSFFVNPVHITTYLKINHNHFFDFLNKLAKITPYTDFSGIHTILMNNYSSLESSH